MLFFFILKGCVQFVTAAYKVILQQSFVKKLRLKMLNALNNIKFKVFMTSDAGRIQNTMSGEIDKISQGYNMYMAAIQQGVMVAVYMGFAFFVDYQFAILVSVGGITTNLLYSGLYKKTKGASRKLTKDSNDKKLVDSNPVFRSYSPNGEAAVYVDNLKFLANDNNDPKEVEKRISLFLFKLNEGWRVTHLNLSSIGSNFYERETPSMEEWQKKITGLEKMVETQNIDLINSLEQLNDVKAQLIRQEKLASLGQLTAGIAHEIKNPLNFINNFSDISVSLVDELKEEMDKEKEQLLVNLISHVLKRNHFSPADLTDEFSKDIFDNYIKDLDPGIRYFLESDYKDFQAYEYLIDDQIRESKRPDL
jgi:hypothetical protein